jgi:hypothetical protein
MRETGVLEGGGLIVELIQNDDAKPASDAPGASDPTLVHGIVKVGIVVADLHETLALLQARGVEIAMGPFPARGNQRSNALIRDNSGNLIQLFGR